MFFLHDRSRQQQQGSGGCVRADHLEERRVVQLCARGSEPAVEVAQQLVRPILKTPRECLRPLRCHEQAAPIQWGHVHTECHHIGSAGQHLTDYTTPGTGSGPQHNTNRMSDGQSHRRPEPQHMCVGSSHRNQPSMGAPVPTARFERRCAAGRGALPTEMGQ